MNDAMVDTQVLVHGILGPALLPKNATEEHRTKAADCRALLMQMDPIYVATISVTEFLPQLTPAEARLAQPTIDRFHRLAFDVAAEDLASKLIRKVRASQARCQECWNVQESSPCKVCGVNKAHAQRLNDIYIAATASTEKEVAVLYTYDGGIHSLAKHLPGVELRKPPAAGGVLFAENPAAAAAQERPAKPAKRSRK